MKKKYKIFLTALIFVCLISVSSTALADTEVVNPLADFSTNITMGNAPLIVLFTDQSTGSPISWLWDFGDGIDSKHAMNATHTFTTPGTYTVTLTVTNAAGSNSVTKAGYITVTSVAPVVKPVADFYSPEVEQARSTGEGVSSSTAISFIDNSTGSPTSWLWDFGDGSTSTIQNPTHTYAGDGGYIVDLTATNAAGSHTISKYGYVLAGISGPASATHFSSNVTSGNAPLTVLFHDDGEEDIISRLWIFGDNTSLYNQVEGNEENATLYATHTYEKSGKYTVMLKVSGRADRGIITKYNYVEVTDNLAPVAEFSLNVTSGTAPLSVLFNDTSVGSPTSWKWNYGDGIESSTRNATHTFTKPGTYTVNLTVSNAKGTASKLATITVLGRSATVSPVAEFTTSVTSGYAPLSAQFKDSSQNAAGWNWNFGDGATSTEQNPTHIYFKAGNYTVNLTASNGNGTDSKLATITVLQHPVYAYIANYGSNTTSVIDTATNKVIATVNVGTGPYGVGVSSDGTKVYVTNNDTNNVSVIDTATNKVIATVNVGLEPWGVSVSPDGTKVYVANSLDNTTSVIDTATNTVIATVRVESYPSGVVVTPDGTKVYVASATYIENSTYNSIVSVIDTATNTVIASVPVGTASTGVAVTPDGTKVYVANSLSNTTSVIDTATNTVIATVPVGIEPRGIAVNPDGTKVYVANRLGNATSVIDTATNTVIATVPVGINPVGVSVTPDGNEVYVTNGVSSSVSVFDTSTNKVKDTVDVGYSPAAFGQFIEQPVLPFANFNSNVSEGYAPLSVQFTDLSKNALEWRWDFGDGGTSTDQNPIQTYSGSGTYNVNLTVRNAKGTAPKTATITVLEDSSSSGSNSSGGSSGSSGGGAGGSPEPQSNVETKEISQTFITSGNPVKFDFPKNVTSVVYVSFDAKKTAGKTTTIVEVLKGKSTLVSGLPSDEVYKSLNIWVGNGGYATSKNIENAVVCFKVEKAWLQSKSIGQSSITLNRYSDKKWNPLSTNLSKEDDEYLYFTAETQGFSPFAITGKTKATGTETQSVVVNEIQNKTNSGNAAATVEQKPEQTQSPNTSGKESIKTPGFEMIYGTISLFGVFLYKRK